MDENFSIHKEKIIIKSVSLLDSPFSPGDERKWQYVYHGQACQVPKSIFSATKFNQHMYWYWHTLSMMGQCQPMISEDCSLSICVLPWAAGHLSEGQTVTLKPLFHVHLGLPALFFTWWIVVRSLLDLIAWCKAGPGWWITLGNVFLQAHF